MLQDTKYPIHVIRYKNHPILWQNPYIYTDLHWIYGQFSLRALWSTLSFHIPDCEFCMWIISSGSTYFVNTWTLPVSGLAVSDHIVQRCPLVNLLSFKHTARFIWTSRLYYLWIHLQWISGKWHLVYFMNSCPENTTHWPSTGLMLGQRCKRWPNIGPTLGHCIVSAGS